MKELDTPLGKAYAKAKGAGTPPPPPTPTPPSSPGSTKRLNLTVSTDKADVASRRYQKIQTNFEGADFGADVTYDRVTGKIQFEIYNTKTEKRSEKIPFTNTNAAIKEAVLTATKLGAIGNGKNLTEIEMAKIRDWAQDLASSVLEFKNKSKADV